MTEGGARNPEAAGPLTPTVSAAAAPNGIHHAGASPAPSSAGAAGFVQPAGPGPRPAQLPQQHADLYRARLAAAQRPDSVVAQILGAGVGPSPAGAAAAPAPVAAALWPARRPGAPIGAPLLLALAALGFVAVVVPSIFLGVALLRAQDARAAAAPDARARLRPEPAQLPAGWAAATGPLRTVSVLDQRFGPAPQAWPDDPKGTAWMASGAYRLFAQDAGRFVAVGAPVAQPLRDVVVTAAFRKVGGPSGGGYGVIVRDQTPGARDGLDQSGRYYVLEVGDRGDFGIWRRDGDRWIELVPWTRAAAVRPGSAANELTVRATGPTLTLLVNGVQVASILDEALPAGGVGVFAGGDLNEVALDRFSVQIPG